MNSLDSKFSKQNYLTEYELGWLDKKSIGELRLPCMKWLLGWTGMEILLY